jgi:hypothetical protein
MRFSLVSGLSCASFVVTALLGLAGCSAGAPVDVDEEAADSADEGSVAEARDALQDDGDVDCAHARCKIGEALDAACNPCVADICEVDPFCCSVFWDALCVNEVETVCGKRCNDKPPFDKCGDGQCKGGEDCGTCPTDCGFCPSECGNGWCELGESCSDCSQDCGACPVCGDGTCNFGVESCSDCSQDCGACPACGDGTCDFGLESCGSCPQDCTSCACGDECQPGPPQLESCSPCVAQVCAVDSFCCTYQWDAICVNEAQTFCGLTCN